MKNNATTTYVSFWPRTGAFALDYLVMLGYLLALTMFFLVLNKISDVSQQLFAGRAQAQLVAFCLVTLPITLYFALGESSRWQATWGKHRLRLMVVDSHGNQIGFWRALARTALKFIPWELSHTLIWELYFSAGSAPAWINGGFALVYGLIGVNVGFLLTSQTRQTLYDLITGTYVVKSKS